jgi:hypothetical protein
MISGEATPADTAMIKRWVEDAIKRGEEWSKQPQPKNE